MWNSLICLLLVVVNFSTCMVANTETNLNKLKRCVQRKHVKESADPNCNLDMIKQNHSVLRRRLICLFNVASIGRCVPLTTLSYYAVGAISFGLLRGRRPLEIVMFPLEFTTTGGLEHVGNYVRTMYGFYVEGAMMLLACTLATLRRHSSATMNLMSEKYRLFSTEK